MKRSSADYFVKFAGLSRGAPMTQIYLDILHDALTWKSDEPRKWLYFGGTEAYTVTKDCDGTCELIRAPYLNGDNRPVERAVDDWQQLLLQRSWEEEPITGELIDVSPIEHSFKIEVAEDLLRTLAANILTRSGQASRPSEPLVIPFYANCVLVLSVDGMTKPFITYTVIFEEEARDDQQSDNAARDPGSNV